MRRLTPLNVAAGLVVTALVAGLVAAGTGAGAAAQNRPAAKPAGAFHQALAAKLGEQLHQPAADVLAALKTAHRALPAGPRAQRRAKRLTERAHALKGRRRARLIARAHALRSRAAKPHARPRARRDAWAAAVARALGVSPADVTAALRALVAERLDSLVHDGWLTTDRRDAELACFDDASRCAGIRPPGLRTLRAGL
jgi:hypothetical protein